MFPTMIVQALFVLIATGIILWGLSQFGIDAWIYKIVRTVIIVLASLWLLYLLFPVFGRLVLYGGRIR
jgi:hypothetical protein